MTTVHDELIDDYLRRMEDAARDLPAARRTELLAEIREHITVALAESADQSEATLRTILDRLGDPEQIVREAGGAATDATAGSGTGPATADGRGYGRVPLWLIVVACGVPVLGGFFPLLGMAVGAGAARVLMSRPARRLPQAFLIWPLVLGTAAAACYASLSSLTVFMPDLGWMELVILGPPLLLGGIVGALLIHYRYRRTAIRG